MSRQRTPSLAPAPADVTDLVRGAVVSRAPEAIIAVDPDGLVLLWNAAAERMFGYLATDVIGHPLPAAADEEVRRVADVLRTRLAPGESISETVVRRRPDGSAVELLADYSPVFGADGELVAGIGVLRDVTAERAHERRLEVRTELTERLHGVVVGLNADLDLATVLQRISDSGLQLLGAAGAGYAVIEGDQLVTAAVSGLPRELVGRRAPVADSALMRLVRSGEPSMVDDSHHYRTTLGLLIPGFDTLGTLAVARTVVHGEVTGGLYVLFDQPDRAMAQEELHVLELLAGHAGVAIANAHAYAEAVRQREHERAIVDAMADGMAVVDEDCVVIEWNPAAADITGLDMREAKGGPLPFPLPDTPGQALDHQLPSGRWIEILVTPIAETGERVVDFRDITEPKALEEAKDLFLAVTSHELRTPITVMKGFAETLLHRWDALGDDDRRSAVQVIVQRTEALAALVEQLLLGSRAGAGTLSVSLAALDVAAALRETVAAFGHLSPRHRVVLDVEPGLPSARADRVAFDNVIAQLLENALKYSPDGGTVRVCAARAGGAVRITVEDDGIGIAAEHAERVFDRFFQADAGNRRRFGGVGLGLYIVRQLVEATGGRVRAVPRDHGACIEVVLPAMTEADLDGFGVTGPAAGRGD